MAARGYPGEPLRGARVRGIEDANMQAGVVVLQGGTRDVAGAVDTDGGRVLTVTALGSDLTSAFERAYGAIDRIEWPDGFFRRDIGWSEIARDKE